MQTWWNNQTLFSKLGFICATLAAVLTCACFRFSILAWPAIGFCILTFLCSIAMALQSGKSRVHQLTSQHFMDLVMNDVIAMDALPPEMQEDIKIAIAHATLEA